MEPATITIREALEEDAEGVRDVFRATYGAHYSSHEFYETTFLKRLILGEDALMFVAIDRDQGRVIGTASVLLEIGAFSDLVGEFGRLAVTPDARGRHVGTMLMEARLHAVRERLHVGIVDARVAHPYSLRIAQGHGFAVGGFAPLRHMFDVRESTCVLGQWFNDGLALRRNNPRIIPEVQAVAAMALGNARMAVDNIIDDDEPAYPKQTGFEVEELTTSGYSNLLRIERGRIRRREVFGPMRLHYGFFKLRKSHAHYLVARDGGRIVGAVGFIRDDHDAAVRIFELIAPVDHAIHQLFSEIERRSREEWDAAVIEVDMRASTPRLQRTLLELGFVPSAYIPAMVFHEVERFDVVRMIRLLAPPDLGEIDLTPEAATMRDVVMRPLIEREVEPLVRKSIGRLDLLRSMTWEQTQRVAALAQYRRFGDGETISRFGEPTESIHLVIAGRVEVHIPSHKGPVGTVRQGETLGEMGLVGKERHSATGVARGVVETIAIPIAGLRALIRRRSDIGLVIYRYLAGELAEKLRRTDAEVR